MRFALMIEPQQGLSFDEQLAVVQRAEQVGFQSFFRSDHYQSFPGPSGEPTTDAWAVLAGLARETSSITLGTLVSPVTFRHVGNLAKVITTVDEMSGGRVEFGLGAGWNDDEHRQLGLPFPDDQGARRHPRGAARRSFAGCGASPTAGRSRARTSRSTDALFFPKPIPRPGRPIGPNGASRPRILTGSGGSPRSFRIAARYADEFNLSSSTPETARESYAALDDACRAIGRDPATLARSVMAGRSHRAATTQRSAGARSALLAAFGDESGGETGSSP